MKITFRKDPSLNTDEIEVRAKEDSPEIQSLIEQLSRQSPKKIKGRYNDEIFLLDIVDIYSFRIEDRTLYAYTNHQHYAVQSKLYEINEQSPHNFIQISKSEIINIDYIHHLELGKNGIIKIIFTNNDFTYSSRRYLKQIKEHLNLWKEHCWAF